MKTNKKFSKSNKFSKSKKNIKKQKGGNCNGAPSGCGGTYELVSGINIPSETSLGFNGLSIENQMAEVYKPDCNSNLSPLMIGSGRKNKKHIRKNSKKTRHIRKTQKTRKTTTTTK